MNSIFSIKKSVFGVLVMMVWCSCTYDHEPINPQEKVCSFPDTVSFNKHILPIFNTSCNITGCHSGNQPTGNLNLEPSVAYSQLMKPGKGYIDTITPQYSLLYAQMNSVSNPMPKSGKLDQCTVNLVLKWVQQKAKNN
jgi:hypothetical protein